MECYVSDCLVKSVKYDQIAGQTFHYSKCWLISPGDAPGDAYACFVHTGGTISHRHSTLQPFSHPLCIPVIPVFPAPTVTPATSRSSTPTLPLQTTVPGIPLHVEVILGAPLTPLQGDGSDEIEVSPVLSFPETCVAYCTKAEIGACHYARHFPA